MTIKVTIWNEGRHEQVHKEVQDIYPDRIDGAIAAGIAHPDFEIRAAARSMIPMKACRTACSMIPTCCSGGGTWRMKRSATG
ncbi:hypothetical protein ACVIRO_004865 [Rhizobium ruizarguesonis]